MSQKPWHAAWYLKHRQHPQLAVTVRMELRSTSALGVHRVVWRAVLLASDSRQTRHATSSCVHDDAFAALQALLAGCLLRVGPQGLR